VRLLCGAVEVVAVSSHPVEQQSSSHSRLSKTNRADSTNHGERPSHGEILSTPLTERDGVALREDVRDYGSIEGDRPLPWRESVNRWRDYIEDNEDTDAVFQNGETGDYAVGGDPHRFAPEYADKQYAKLKDLQRGLQQEYGKRLHTAMLTFTASWCPDGDPVPPVDHLLELDSSWESVRRELSRQLGDRRWEYLAILEPHKSGYLHIHMAVFVDGVVTRDLFAPVIEAHVRNCDLAESDAHDTGDDSVISVRHAGKDRSGDCAGPDDDGDGSLDELAIYLAEYLGTYGDDPLVQSDQQQMANTVLWATGKQRWRPSQGAQSHMASEKPDEDIESAWELVGIRSGTEYYPCEEPDGGVERFVTSSLDPPAD
jgi:hypothetical protein